MDNSGNRERIYWGGNLFCLLADVQIRVRTGNRHKVDDAIRAILNAGGNGDANWSIERIIRVGDKATGTTVLKEYTELGTDRGDIHLDSLWQTLGVIDNRHGKYPLRQFPASVGRLPHFDQFRPGRNIENFSPAV